MTEGGTDLRILTTRDPNDNAIGSFRGTKRRLEISVSEEIQVERELQRIERPSAPKRRRRSKEGVVGKVKRNISSVYQYINELLFGCSEEVDDISMERNKVEKEPAQEQAVDMTQEGYNGHYISTTFSNKENSTNDPDVIEIDGSSKNSMTLKADIHHRNDSSDESFDNIQKKAERQRISTPMQKPNEFKRPSIGFGLQASGPLSTKTAMANMRFQGRQFSVSTQEKRNAERKKRTPSALLNEINQRNLSASTKYSPYKPLSVAEREHRKDLIHGVSRSKAGGAIMHTSAIKRNAVFSVYRKDELRKYKAILENSPGTGLIGGACTNRFNESKKSGSHSLWSDLSYNNRTSLFQTPKTSPAISKTRYNPQVTEDHRQKISNQKHAYIPVVNLEDDDEIKKKEPKSVMTTIFTPKSLGPDADVTELLDKYSPKVSLKKHASPEIRSDKNQLTPNGLETQLKQENVYKDEYLQELLDKYVSRSSAINRSIREENIKVDHHKDRRLQAEKSIEARLKQHLKITEVAIPEPKDDAVEEGEEVILPEMTSNMEKIVDSALQSGGVTLIDAFKIPITGKDVNTLRGLNWLNDEVINFYMQMIVERASTSESGFPKAYATNTFFYPKLMQSGHSALKRWTRKIDIFSFDLIIVPVHLGMHWCLATIDLKRKGVFYYDSMGGDNTECLDALLQYLQDEHMDKKKSSFDTTGFQCEIVKDIPQQMNGSDCGMFACKFAEYLSRDAPISFSQEDMPYFRRRMIYEIVKNNLMYP